MEIKFLDKFPNCPLLSEISFRHFPAAQVAKKKGHSDRPTKRGLPISFSFTFN